MARGLKYFLDIDELVSGLRTNGFKKVNTSTKVREKGQKKLKKGG